MHYSPVTSRLGCCRSTAVAGWRRLLLSGSAAVALALAAATLPANSAFAQQNAPTREYPSQEYYLAMNVFSQGDFVSASRAFQSAGRSGIRSTEGRWVDSICYFTMVGECYYQMGELGPALDQFTAALNLLVAHQHWMLRVEFPPQLEPSQTVPRRVPTWGPGTRRIVLARLPNRYPILQGNSAAANERAIQLGGVVALPEFYLINANEIARCSAVAIRRRAEIMGVACQHDSLTGQVLAALQARPAPPNHWTQAWISVQLGLANAAAGQTPTAISELTAGSVAGGGFEHPLSAIALLELGKLAFRQEQFGAAAQWFLEASLSGAMLQQFDVVEEAIRYGALTHLVTGQAGHYGPLGPVAEWSRRDSNWVAASALISAAQNSAEANQTSAAARFADQARRAIGRGEMVNGAVGARLSYANALVAYQSGELNAGDTAFASLMTYQKKSSLRLFEIALVDGMFTSALIPERIANDLYSTVLREPTAKDWAVDPVETLSVVLTPHELPLEHWFEATLSRKEHEKTLELTDRIRRHRFYTTLPMGGRLLALRWVLEAPNEALPDDALRQRRELLDHFPKYEQLSQQANAIQKQLAALPTVSADEDEQREQTKLLNTLADISLAQEVMLREMGLRRLPAEFVFPPQLDFAAMQEQLDDGVLVLSFLNTSRGVYGFATSKENPYNGWRLEQPQKLREQLVLLLRQFGQVEKNQPVDEELLRDEQWKAVSAEMLAQLTGGDAKVWESIDELVVVPDGPLWYVPFGALQPTSEPDATPLITKLRVRYAPTLALVVPDRRRASPLAETGVMAEPLFPRDDPRLGDQAVADLQDVVPRVTRLAPPQLAPAAMLASRVERLVVLADLEGRSRGPYDWMPLPLDRNKPGGTLADWIALPWRGPQQVVLPGFHTAAENSLKNGGEGNDVFLSVCGLMASGARTVLLSRWRSGGQSSYDLTREFVQELPYSTAADAWQRSVLLGMSSDLDPDREPRLRTTHRDYALRADHPFFWAGYLLVDTGATPPVDDAAATVVAEVKEDEAE